MVRETVGVLAGLVLALGACGARAAEPVKPAPPAAKAAPATAAEPKGGPDMTGVVVEEGEFAAPAEAASAEEGAASERPLSNRVFPRGAPDVEEAAEQLASTYDDDEEGLPGQEPRGGGDEAYEQGAPAARGYVHAPVPSWAYGHRPGVFGLGGAYGYAPVPYIVGDGEESLLDGESTDRRWDTDPRMPELEDLEYQP